jgi:hypothetical protein
MELMVLELLLLLLLLLLCLELLLVPKLLGLDPLMVVMELLFQVV